MPTSVIPSNTRNPGKRRLKASRRFLTLPLWLLLLLTGSASLASSLAGCAAQSRSAAPAALIADADWPARVTAGLEQLAARPLMFLDDDEQERGASAARVVRCQAHGQGIVLEFQRAASDESRPSVDETELAFVSFSLLTRDGNVLGRKQAQLPRQISLSDVHAGVRWILYEPKNRPARGLVVHLGGNKYVRRALLKHGWVVLSSSGTGRYSQRRASPQTFEIERGEKLNQVAAQLAAVIDDELADWPYSLEAVLEYLAEHRPDVRQRPLVMMGFSIGALGLPAVVARMPDRCNAAVIVAGGANLLQIAQQSRKADRGIELHWTGAEPTEQDWQGLYAAYLERVKLDPCHSAAALTDKPVLVYHAHYDQVVPAATGELLYARLGSPRRFVFPVGHRHLLRIVMRLEAERIVKWTETAVAARATARGQAESP